jgi:hypothetical protein
VSPEGRATPLKGRDVPLNGCDVPRKVCDFPARKGAVFCGEAAARLAEPVSTLTLVEWESIRDGVGFSESAAGRQRAGRGSVCFCGGNAGAGLNDFARGLSFMGVPLPCFGKFFIPLLDDFLTRSSFRSPFL